MISDRLLQAFNEQIEIESSASHGYLNLAIWCASNGFDGAAKFFFKQSDEEREHMLKLIHYVIEREGQPIAAAKHGTDHSPAPVKDIFDVLQQFYANEQSVTAAVFKLLKTAEDDGDYNAVNFLQWYVKEQHEEENQARSLIEKANLIGKEGPYKYLIDEMVGKS